MPIDIVVEDGTGVADANSYVTVAEARLYASNRGVILPANPVDVDGNEIDQSGDDNIAVMLIKATDYLESLEYCFQGTRTYKHQALSWPRKWVILNGNEIRFDFVLDRVKNAQSQLVLAVNSGIELQPNISPSDYVIREKVGPLETEYANPQSVGISTTFTAVDALLRPLFGGNCGKLKTIRV